MKNTLKNKKKLSRRGQSLMELLIGMAVGAVLIVGSATIITSAIQTNGAVTNIQIQAQLGQELLNNTKAWAQGNWNALLALATGTSSTYYLNTSSSPFTILPASSTGSAGYSYYRSVTVSANASGTNTNFPMLFSGTYTWLKPISAGGKISNLTTAPNGGQEPADLVFATSTANCGASDLNYETESYVSSTGAVNIWIKIPSLTAGTVIYACYGAASVTTDQSHPSSTWNSNYLGVWHFGKLVGGNASDSTSFVHNVYTAAASVAPSSTPGYIGVGAQLTNGNNQAFDVSSTALGSIPVTIEAWVNPSAFPISTFGSAPGDVVFTTRKLSADISPTLGISNDRATGEQAFFGADSSGLFVGAGGTTVFATGTWYDLIGTYDNAGTWKVYVNGVLEGTNNFTLAGTYGGTFTGSPWNIGAAPQWSGIYSSENLDEERVSNAALSPSWILTEYNNQSNPFTFYTVGSEQSLGNGYTYSRPITVVAGQVSSTQTNFPMLVSGNWSYLAATSTGGLVQDPNGNDIIFTSDSAGINKLNWEVESYSSSTGNIVAWVNIPTLTSTTTIYMFYGNAGVNTFQGNVTGTWNSNFVAVWHLQSTDSTTSTDSTSNQYNGSNISTASTTGQIGKGGSFNGTSGYVSIGNNNLLPGGVGTVSIWAKLSSTTSVNNYLIAYGNDAGPQSWGIDAIPGGSTSTSIKFLYGSTQWVVGTGSGNPMAWHKYDVVASGSNTQSVYYDGNLIASGTYGVITPSAGLGMNIGKTDQSAPYQYFTYGNLDEPRVSNIARSSSWILTEYNNESNPSGFYTIGSQAGGTSSSVDSVINNGVTFQRSFSVSDVYRDSNGYVTSTQSGNFYDPSTKLITATVSVASSSIAHGIYSMYLTRNGDNYVSQATWSGKINNAPTKLVNNSYANASNTLVNSSGAFQLQGSLTQIQAIQINNGNYNYGITTTLPAPTTKGDTIIVSYEGQNTSNTASVSDSVNGTYSIATGTADADGRNESRIFYMPNASSVNSVTVTLPFVSWYGEIYEYSGLNGTLPLDQVAVSPGVTYSIVTTWSAPLTTTLARDLVVGVGIMPDPVVMDTSTFSMDWYPNGPTGYGPIFASGVAISTGSYPFHGTSNDYGRTALAAASFFSVTSTAVSGTFDAQPFDTGSVSGAQLNSFIWQGSQPVGTTVQFQFATSNSASGPWSFVGPDGTSNTYFSGSHGTPVNLVSTTNGYTLFSGYRYFSYRAFLSSTSTTITPIVSGVSVNWSP